MSIVLGRYDFPSLPAQASLSSGAPPHDNHEQTQADTHLSTFPSGHRVILNKREAILSVFAAITARRHSCPPTIILPVQSSCDFEHNGQTCQSELSTRRQLVSETERRLRSWGLLCPAAERNRRVSLDDSLLGKSSGPEAHIFCWADWQR